MLENNDLFPGLFPFSGSVGPVSFYLTIFGVSVTFAWFLADAKDKRFMLPLTLLGLIATCLKIWLLQQAPQWHDTNPDSETFQLHAQAFMLHWQGLSVQADIHRLAGFLAIHELSQQNIWPADSTLLYSSVFGTHEWFYAAYLAIWQLLTPDWYSWAIYSNAAMAAFFPAVAFGLARVFGASLKVAWGAASLALLDPSAAVNGAWLLKDTAAGWLALAAIWAALRLLQAPRWQISFFFACTAAWLGTVRFAALAAILLACTCLLPFLNSVNYRKSVRSITAGAAGTLFLFSALYFTPVSWERLSAMQPLYAIGTIMSGQKATLVAASSESAADETVIDWRERVQGNPLRAALTSVSRTLFAPYPWVAITHGLDFRTGMELYYPGVVFWILCLPGLAWGMMQLGRTASLEFLFIATVLGALLGAYVVFMGEWSTRQRVFMLPVFFAIAAIGWSDLRSRWLRRR